MIALPGFIRIPQPSFCSKKIAAALMSANSTASSTMLFDGGKHVDSNNIGSNVSSGSGYGSSSGTRYQYDFNDPSYQRAYSLDLDAQRRDQMNLNPDRRLDRGLGQRGGGIYDDNWLLLNFKFKLTMK